ncbi:MAG TPA: hypothetical protein VMS64_35270 [Candidatus Methylomirabilis sp.]|nr:hypothetical protein [Candidatus Methylomirabilis sp.]
MVGSEGLPYGFATFEKLGVGRFEELKPSGSGWQPRPNSKPEGRRMEIPLDNVVVRFP